MKPLTSDVAYFPDVKAAAYDEYGIFAYGGDLSVERLIEAYKRGIFPYFAFRLEEIKWACPQERFVIFPSKIHVSHSMRNLLNGGKFSVTFNNCFEKVIGNCAALRIHELCAWLGADMVEAYVNLHNAGCASSVEVWQGALLGAYMV